jgi:hypothetical protein
MMIDIHAPEQGIHGVRDFFMHLLTITVGLFIALSLENAAEAIHHRHQRREAESQIREEVQNNLTKLHDGAADVLAERTGMMKVLQTLEARAQGQQLGALQESEFTFHEGPLEDSAWLKASSTGVLSYMDYAEVEGFSAAYKEQTLLEGMEQQALDDYLELMPILEGAAKKGEVSIDDAKDALPYVRKIVAHLDGMLAVGAGTIGAYQEALKK